MNFGPDMSYFPLQDYETRPNDMSASRPSNEPFSLMSQASLASMLTDAYFTIKSFDQISETLDLAGVEDLKPIDQRQK